MMSELADQDAEAGYDREVVERVWGYAQVIPGNDPAVWRKDEFGAWIHRAPQHLPPRRAAGDDAG